MSILLKFEQADGAGEIWINPVYIACVKEALNMNKEPCVLVVLEGRHWEYLQGTVAETVGRIENEY
jgi:hypothetical protein